MPNKYSGFKFGQKLKPIKKSIGINLEHVKEILYICNTKERGDHCIYNCPHGLPHISDGCTSIEFCKLGRSGKLRKVKCRRATKKELKEYSEYKKGII